MAVKRIGQERKVKTDFYENSAKFDSLHSKTDHGYYQSTPEMFARTFACYVKDKLEEVGCHSDYICGHADMSVTECKDKDGNWKTVSAVPEGEEHRMINKNFDRLFEEMRELGMLHPYERSLDPKELSNYNPSITELLQKKAGEDKNISLDERIRQNKEKESSLDRNIHDKGKGQYEFNLFQ